jgi:hypothetical protein
MMILKLDRERRPAGEGQGEGAVSDRHRKSINPHEGGRIYRLKINGSGQRARAQPAAITSREREKVFFL